LPKNVSLFEAGAKCDLNFDPACDRARPQSFHPLQYFDRRGQSVDVQPGPADVAKLFVSVIEEIL